MEKERKVEDFYNNISKNYDRYQDRFCDRILEYFILKYIRNSTSLSILDAGGGIGRFSWKLSELGNKIVLTDISENMLEKAKEIANKKGLKNISFIKESIIDMKNQKNKSFDIVLMMNGVLNYCGDCKKAIYETHRVLRKNGLFIGSVNNRFIYCKIHELKDCKFDLFKKSMEMGNRYIIWGNSKNEGHWTHEFLLSELQNLLSSKFKIIKILGVFNLIDKYKEYKDDDLQKLFNLQIEYAQKDEFLQNSSDFMFIAKKI